MNCLCPICIAFINYHWLLVDFYLFWVRETSLFKDFLLLFSKAYYELDIRREVIGRRTLAFETVHLQELYVRWFNGWDQQLQPEGLNISHICHITSYNQA